MPGLVDTHIHAPQYAITGTGYDLPSVYEWLNKYTFPTEKRFEDLDLARNVYRKVVVRNRCSFITHIGPIKMMYHLKGLVMCLSEKSDVLRGSQTHKFLISSKIFLPPSY